ncbi:excalibur calcium-binding domain-containing protein [Streptomyces sp. NPDC048577]|uniref:excalibur calcium-binding domain-containing protein n=1 Tax=Streptomyces sp. NPDC048577 TaxID=3157209 RepID=UPI0034243C72
MATLAGCGGARADGKPTAATPSAPSPTTTAARTPHPTAVPVPRLVDDEYSASASDVHVDVLANDTVDGRALTSVLSPSEFEISIESSPRHGTAKVSGTSITYTPAAGYAGQDEFTYQVSVTRPGTTADTAVVRIAVTAPSPTKAATPTPTPGVYYRNCDAARTAGAAPVRRGEPGYGSHLDRDGDGIGCEPYSGGSSTGGSGSGESSSGGGSVYYKNCTAARAAGAAPVHQGDPGYGRHLDRDGDGVGCE